MSSPPSSDRQSIASTQSVRGKNDPAWEHFTSMHDVDGKTRYTCLYCSNTFKGGGINRMKYHLAGIKGQISQCKKVPPDVQHQMQKVLKEIGDKKKQSKETHESIFDDDLMEIGDDMSDDVREKRQQQSKGKRKLREGIDNYFAPRTTPGSQPSIKSVLAGKQAIKRADMAWARFFYDACIPFNALHSPYYQVALNATAAIGPGYKGPSYNDVRVNLLGDCKKECRLLVEGYRKKWASSGCTIMADGWSDQRHRTLINFLVYCSSGMTFVKSVDASDVVKDAQTLCDLFTEIVEWVGPQNVVHMVTDNAANYVAAGRLLHEKYDNIFWSPCAAHCLNLILKDIGSLPHVNSLAQRASKITIFVYNHTIFLSWLRNKPEWKEIVRPGITRFATTFITLKNLYEHKQVLQSLVTNRHFTSHRLSRSAKGKQVSSIILDNKFWDDCLMVVKIVAPLIRLLRIVDADEKPSLGYVYDGMDRAEKTIKNIFLNKERLYRTYIDIIDDRWDKHLRHNIHVASYFLNPSFIYDEGFIQKAEVMNGLLNLLEIKSICSNEQQAMREIKIYQDGQESFSRKSALNARKNLQPDEWWRLFGTSAPNLQKIAIRLLSQTSSASGCERNWSVFERIHTKKRNRLEHQRLNDLVYVKYNLRLQQRGHYKKRNYDPIDYECLEETDFWIEEDIEEAPPELDYEELESAIYEDGSIPNVDDHVNRDSTPNNNENVDDLRDVEVDDLDSPDAINRFGGSSNIERVERFRLIDEIDSDDVLP